MLRNFAVTNYFKYINCFVAYISRKFIQNLLVTYYRISEKSHFHSPYFEPRSSFYLQV